MYNSEPYLLVRFDAYSKAFLAGSESSTPTRIFDSTFYIIVKLPKISSCGMQLSFLSGRKRSAGDNK
jgi:hypothetical protein